MSDSPGGAVALSNVRAWVGDDSGRYASNVLVRRRGVLSFPERSHEHAHVNDSGKTQEVHKGEQPGVDMNDVDGGHPAVELVGDPVPARRDGRVRGMRIPLTHERHHFELGVLRRQGEDRGSFQKVRGVRRTVVRTLNPNQRLAHVPIVEQVAEGELGTSSLQSLGAGVTPSNEGADGGNPLSRSCSTVAEPVRPAAAVTRILGLVMTLSPSYRCGTNVYTTKIPNFFTVPADSG